MRSFVLVLALSVSSCDASHEATGDAGDAAAPIDAATPPDTRPFAPDAAGELTVTFFDPQFTTCACHHGCGPGIDGMVTLAVNNATTTAHALVITRVIVDSIGSPGGPYTTPENGHFQLVGAAADGSLTVAAGATGMLRVVIYLDIPIVEPGTDDVRIEATVDGTTVTYALLAVSVSSGPGC